MKTYFYLCKSRINEKGTAPIVCRVTHLAERRDFRTGIYILPEYWDYKRSYPKSNEKSVISRLTIIANDLYAVFAACERDKVTSIDEIMVRYKELNIPQLTTIESISVEYLECVKPTELVRTRLTVAVKQFIEMTGIAKITAVTLETVKGFESAMIAKKWKSSVRVKKLQYIKRVVVYAFNKKYVSSNAFALYKLPAIAKPTQTHLTPKEVSTIQKHNFASDRLNYVRDLFLFQNFTGLSYCDLFLFNRTMVIATENFELLKGERVKNGEEYILPWIKEAALVAEKYNYSFEYITNQKYNAYLKEIAQITGIEKTLTTHVARKTFAQSMIDAGYSAEAVSKMMGHASFNMTQKHYARIGEARIINEVLKLAS